MRTGKNVVADYLVTHYHFKQTAFADAIKRLGMEFFDLSYEECYKEKTPRSRDVLQRIGTEVFRAIDPDVWCRYVLKNIPEGQNTVISDVRFPNEAMMIKDYGGKIIRVQRNTEQTFGTDHVSETALDTYVFDFSICNNGSLEELYLNVDKIMTELEA